MNGQAGSLMNACREMEMWGSKGWTCQTQERAWEKFRENIFLSSLTKKDAFSDPKTSADMGLPPLGYSSSAIA